MSTRRIEYLAHLSVGDVSEFAIDGEMILEALHGLEAQMRLVSMMLAAAASKEVYFPSEFLRSIGERHHQRHLECQFALRQLLECAHKFEQRKFRSGKAAFDDGKTLFDVHAAKSSKRRSRVMGKA